MDASHRTHDRRRRAYQASLLGGLTVASLLVSNAGAVHAGATRRAAGVVAPGGPSTVGTGMAMYGAPVEGGVSGPDSPASFNATLPNGRRITPAGASAQVGENPLNSVVTPDGKFLIVSNNDERNPGARNTAFSGAQQNGAGKTPGGFTLSTVDTSNMQVVSSTVAPANPSPSPSIGQLGIRNTDAAGSFFLGLAIKGASAPYTVYASGGYSDLVYVYSLGADGVLQRTASIKIPTPTDPTRPNYGMAFPAGLTLSADGSRLYVVNDNANNVVTIDTGSNAVVGSPIPVGFFPYTGVLSPDGSKLYVSNWGVADRTLNAPAIASTTSNVAGNVTVTGTLNLGGAPGNLFANPVTDPARTSSVSVINLANNNVGSSVSLAQPIDGVNVVGGTHPSAMAVSRRFGFPVLYVADANEDTVAVIDARTDRLIRKIQLPSPVSGLPRGGVLGLIPDAVAVSPRGTELYVAEAGVNAVAVFNTANPTNPLFIGYIPTGWFPTGVTVGPDNHTVYITNEKGVGSDYGFQGSLVGTPNPDVNLIFGTVQQVQLSYVALRQGISTVRRNLYNAPANAAANRSVLDTIRPNIQHVFFILRENKTYDTYFGSDPVLNARGANGNAGAQYNVYSQQVPNTRALAEQFAVGDNAYADSEESNAGHFFALAGTSTDFQQKTLLLRFNRPLLNIKNEDPEDYPLQGFIFNNALRNGVSYREYGDLIRTSGYDDYSNPNACKDDPGQCPNGGTLAETAAYTYTNTTAPTIGLGGLYAGTTPALAALSGHIDPNYPGWDLRISDQRRVAEYLKDVGNGSGGIDPNKVPQFTYMWLPDDHTGGLGSYGRPTAANPQFEVADNDAALGQLVYAISHSPVWPNSAIFVTEDDGQSSPDHVNPHRTYTMVISPYARHGAVIHRLSSTVGVPKTVEELLGLPAMNLGDLLGSDLSDYFQTTPDLTPYGAPLSAVPTPAPTLAASPTAAATGGPAATTSPAAAASANVSLLAAARAAVPMGDAPAAPAETMRIATLLNYLNHSGPDLDSTRLGMIENLFFQSETLAQKKAHMKHHAYRMAQRAIYHRALAVLNNPHIPTNDYDG